MISPNDRINTSMPISLLLDPVATLRRRMYAILAEFQDLLNLPKIHDPLSQLVASWFLDFKSAVQRNENLQHVIDEFLPRLEEILGQQDFQENLFVQTLLSNFLPRLRVIFGNNILPNIPLKISVELPTPTICHQKNRQERLRQITERVLKNRMQVEQQEVRLFQEVNTQLNDTFQQIEAKIHHKFGAIKLQMDEGFLRQKSRLDNVKLRDSQSLGEAQKAIDFLENRIAELEAQIPHLQDKVVLIEAALDNFANAIAQAKNETWELQQAIDRRNEEKGNSLLIAAIGVMVCILIPAFTYGTGTTLMPIPGGAKLGLTFTF